MYVIYIPFLMQYTPGIDIWSIGCIFAEMLTGRPLFPGKNVVHQLDIMTDLLGTPPPESIARVSLLKSTRQFSEINSNACLSWCSEINAEFLVFLTNSSYIMFSRNNLWFILINAIEASFYYLSTSPLSVLLYLYIYI